MNEAVSDIIVARARETDTLSTMVAWSVALHVAIAIVAAVMPHRSDEAAPRTVMTISLGGATGPRTGGLTQIGGRTVQAPAPEQPVRRVEAPPAPKPPPMALPDPRARTRPQPKPLEAPRDAVGRTPSTGEQPRQGSARAETGARGQGFGLSSGGGGGGGQVTLDVGDFCCREYLDEMVRLIQQNWQQNQGVVGSTVMRFTILRNGTIQGVQIEKPSGFIVLDNAAQRALLVTQRLPPLPAPFPNPTLTVHLQFDYQR